MTSADDDRRSTVLLSMQRALWDMISPDIRGIAVSWAPDLVRARFVYDREVDEDAWETVREVETEVLADLVAGVRTEFTAEFMPVEKPRDSRDGEYWVYRRRE